MQRILLAACVIAAACLSLVVAQTATSPTWQKVTVTNGFQPRVYGSAFKLASQGSNIYMLGGDDGNSQAYQTVVVSTDLGQNWNTVGGVTPFSADYTQVGVAGDKVFVIGGSDANIGLSSTIYTSTDPTFASGTWAQVSSGAFSPARFQHCAVVWNTVNVAVFGGSMFDDTTGQFAPISDNWYSNNGGITFTRTQPTWSARYGMSCAAVGNTLVMAGGSTGRPDGTTENVLSEVWVSGSNGASWFQTPAQPSTFARVFAGPIIQQWGRLVIAGGKGAGNTPLNDVYTASQSANTWARDASSDAPFTARSGHAIIAVGAQQVIYVLGGATDADGTIVTNDVFQLNVPTDSSTAPYVSSTGSAQSSTGSTNAGASSSGASAGSSGSQASGSSGSAASTSSGSAASTSSGSAATTSTASAAGGSTGSAASTSSGSAASTSTGSAAASTSSGSAASTSSGSAASTSSGSAASTSTGSSTNPGSGSTATSGTQTSTGSSSNPGTSTGSSSNPGTSTGSSNPDASTGSSTNPGTSTGSAPLQGASTGKGQGLSSAGTVTINVLATVFAMIAALWTARA